MLNEFFTDHGYMMFFSVIFFLVLSSLISFKRRYREEKPDHRMIYGPIRGMYVCYQCDTIFNTLRCPKCNEEAIVPLIHLTGSVLQTEKVTAVISKLQTSSTWKIPAFQTLQDGEAVTPASRPKASNGAASKVPVKIPVLTSERGSELS